MFSGETSETISRRPNFEDNTLRASVALMKPTLVKSNEAYTILSSNGASVISGFGVPFS